MPIRNIYERTMRQVDECHGGVGTINFQRVWSADDFETKWSFVDHAILPPGTSIGVHQHGENEEMYIVLRGKGVISSNGEEREVRTGDMILNKKNSIHGLRNESSEDIEVLIIEVEM